MPPAAPTPSAEPRPPRAAGRRAGQVALWVLGKGWPFLLLLGLFVLWTGWQRTAAGGAAGTSFEGEAAVGPPAATAASSPLPAAAWQGVSAPRPGRRLRVGTYNIQGSVDNAAAKLAALGRTIDGVDVCGLNEVRGNSYSADRKSQVQQVAEGLGRAWLFAPAERRFWRDAGGNGIVSRLPAAGWVRLPLPASDEVGAFRNVVLARVVVGGSVDGPGDSGGGPDGRVVTFLVTHLDRGVVKPAQAAAIASLFRSVGTPAVLLADLNSGSDDPALRPILTIPDAVDALGGRLGPSPMRVDWILARGLTVADAGRVGGGPSDHDFYWAELAVP